MNNVEENIYKICQILRSIQSDKIDRQTDDSFAMNLSVMALMFSISYHENEFRNYWKFVTKEEFPADKISEIADKISEIADKISEIAGRHDASDPSSPPPPQQNEPV